MKSYVFDSYTMIAFFEDEPGAEQVAHILDLLVHKEAQASMSIINWGEIYYSTMRVQGIEQAEKAIKQVSKYPIRLVVADKSLTVEAARLKGKYKIAYADCFAAALSEVQSSCDHWKP